MDLEHIAWAEKYRPNSLENIFLPKETRKVLETVVSDKNIPNLFFSGPPGVGKTTTAISLVEQIGAEYQKINGSMNGNIDNLRNEISHFASTVSMNGEKKYVILDEADYLTTATQAALRGFIDEYGANTGFILTANLSNRIIEPIKSRLTEVSFLFSNNEKVELAKGLIKFLQERMEEDNVDYDLKALQQFVGNSIKSTTDIRRIITDAQKIATTGVFNHDSLLNSDKEKFDEIISILKDKNFDKMREWVGENSDIESDKIYRHLYENIKNYSDNSTLPVMIQIINKHQYMHAFVADKEINMVDCLAEISITME